MDLNEFISKYEGKGVDVDGYPSDNKYQCVDLYRFYCKEVLQVPQSPPVPGAADIWDSYLPAYFGRIENTLEGVPQKGDIVIWSKKAGGGWGHVAVFVKGNINKFTSFDQNWPTGSLCHLQGHYYTNVLGWLRPNSMGKQSPDEILVGKTVFEELVAKATAYDRFLKHGWENLQQITQELENRDKAIADLKGERDGARDDVEEYRKKFNALLAGAAKTLNCRIDETEVYTHLEALEGKLTELEQTADNYAKDKLAWAVTEQELLAEKARLEALLEQKNVLENVALSALVAEILKRIARALRNVPKRA